MSYYCGPCRRTVTSCRHRVNRGVGSSHSSYSYNDDPADNAGQIGVDTSGDLTIGLGVDLAVDTKNGDLVVDIPGTSFGIDTGIEL